MAFDLTRMLAPRSVAFIGASSDPQSIGGQVARNVLARNVFRADAFTPSIIDTPNPTKDTPHSIKDRPVAVHLVNPHHQSLYGVECLNAVAELPNDIDLAVLLTPWSATPNLLAELAERRIANVLCISIATESTVAGVLWQSRKALLDRLRRQLNKLQIGLLGPSSFGMQLPHVALNASLAGLMPRPGNLAVISHTEALSTLLGEYCISQNLGVRALLTLGDAIDINAAELLDYFATDPQTAVVLLHLECTALRDSELRAQFLSSLRACANRRRQVVVWPVPDNAEAALSPDDWRALLQQAGAMTVNCYEALAASAQLSQFSAWSREDVKDLVLVGNGTSLLELAARSAQEKHFNLPSFELKDARTLRPLRLARTSLSNPLNLGRAAMPEQYALAKTLLQDKTVVFCHHPNSFAAGEQIAGALCEAGADTQTRHLTLFLGQANRSARARLMQGAIPSFDQPALAFESLQLWHHAKHAQALPVQATPWVGDNIMSAGGIRMVLRDIHALDQPALQRGFSRLSPEEVRMRFMYPLKTLTQELAQKLVRLDPRREIALVLAEPKAAGEAEIFGVVRASRRPSYQHRPRFDAEFAIVVPSALSGQGLGKRLMLALITRCQAAGIKELWGDVLAENDAMLGLAKKLGFRTEKHPDEGHLLRVVRTI